MAALGQATGFDDLNSVENLIHREILKAILQPDLSPQDVADKLRISRSYVYSVARRYLPEGYLSQRKQARQLASLKAKATEWAADDMVEVVQPVSDKGSCAITKQMPCARPQVVVKREPELRERIAQALPNSASQMQETTPLEASNSVSLDLNYAGASLKWTGVLSPEHAETFYGLMREFKAIFGAQS